MMKMKGLSFTSYADNYNKAFAERGLDVRVETYCAYGKYSFFITINSRQIHTGLATRAEAIKDLGTIYNVILATLEA
jgi:hypothetical protein